MTKRHKQWGAEWFSLPKTPPAPRPGTARAVPRPDAPMCACGCGRRILPLAQQYGDLYFSRACLEKARYVGMSEQSFYRRMTSQASPRHLWHLDGEPWWATHRQPYRRHGQG